MAISFRNIPPSIRVPLAYFEVSAERAATFQIIQNAVLLASVPAGSTLPPLMPTLVISADHARSFAGPGSALGRQCERWFQNNVMTPLYVLAAAEPAAGWTASVGSIEWAGPATGAGTISLYIGGRLVRVNVGNGDDAADIALAARDAINAQPQTGVVATIVAADPEITVITAAQLGVLGRLNIAIGLGGLTAGEVLPPGVEATITPMTAATGRPDITVLLAALADMNADFIMSPFPVVTFPAGAPDPPDLNALDEFFNDTSGRWSWVTMMYGHGFTAAAATVGQLSALGRTRNGNHVSIFGFNGSPTPHDEWLTAYVGQAAGSLITDPARPCQALPLIGITAPPRNLRFGKLERQVLYYDGISSYEAGDDGTAYINRLITTYRVNMWGAPDNSYLDVETLYQLMYFNRFMHQRISTKFPRHKLANDGQRFGAGQAIVTPRIMRSEFIAAYGQLVEMGLFENIEGFEREIIVERDSQDPNRLNVLATPDLINQLRIAAVLVAFILQDPTAAGRVA